MKALSLLINMVYVKFSILAQKCRNFSKNIPILALVEPQRGSLGTELGPQTGSPGTKCGPQTGSLGTEQDPKQGHLERNRDPKQGHLEQNRDPKQGHSLFLSKVTRFRVLFCSE